MQIEREIYGEVDMEAFGAEFSAALLQGGVVHLEGNLGMGKTTLVRGILRGMGYQGPVKSPTYTIVEPYEIADLEVYHFDLYRVADPEELEFMGIRDYFNERSLCLIEWAEMGQGILPAADLVVHLSLIRQGRHVLIKSLTDKGDHVMTQWQTSLAS
ncbi:tRNA (adenosine(37)-N6)-threonylcarbamoyltransferase complex ATPase subunit type 1 TsaE [Marinomonas sp. THO17]|uniref:tRNA (adenosine(37)-N6)-threonylcarbamoyltransferase complex ATPase subunit type 1 TsaE n=1 Tax=Marinomonas sp. THO17 TaxID=3149048 RepID=UPI00336BDB7F